MKKAFSLAELLITITIIGVLTALLVTTLTNVNPNRDRVMYKKAMYNLANAVSYIFEHNSTVGSAANGLASIQGTNFCIEVCKALNTRTACTATNSTCRTGATFASPEIKTIDGVRYWGLSNNFSTSDPYYLDVYVDYDTSNTDLGSRGAYKGNQNHDLRVRITRDGKVYADSSFTYENKLLDDTQLN